MSSFDPSTYPAAIADLLRRKPLAPLGPGSPDRSLRPALEAVGAAFPVGADRELCDACRAGLWLAFDFLDEAHTISQDLPGVEGSYWHALMHRREPDHGNAAYWLRRVGRHPIFDELARAAAELGYRGRGASWDAFEFNDRCEEYRGQGGEMEEMLRRVQQAEWELLFAWCYRRLVLAPSSRSG
jgi:hypothetical protein